MSRKSNGTQLIQYVLRYSLKEKFNQIKSDATVILKNHIRSTRVDDIIKEFKLNESYRIYHRKDNVKLFHDCLSFSPKNKGIITKAMLKDIAEKYIELRAKNVLSIIIHHAEKNHDHLHCVTAGVKLDGYSSRISKQQFKHLKLELEKFQQEKFPELCASKINHRIDRSQTKEQIIKAVQNVRETGKNKLLEILQNTFTAANSQQDFLQRLTEQNCLPYYRNDSIQGVMIEGRKFRFSKLGFDESKFKELDQREKDFKMLSDVDQLRTQKPQLLEKEDPVEKDYSSKLNTDENVLDELQALRNEDELSQSHERVIDIDDCEAPEVSSIEDIRKYRDFSITESDLEMEE